MEQLEDHCLFLIITTHIQGARAAYLKINPTLNLNIKDWYAFYNGGRYFVDAENTKDTEIIASYEDNKPAIIKCTYGDGTAILSGVHLEYDHALMKNQSLNNIRKILKAHDTERIKLLNYIFKNLNLYNSSEG
ncbi:hypothetical protein RAS_05640 [Rickettsia asiatica]|uniref:Biotin-protein ligase N-terminal domain-containing protein n=1 Tax=Rickettsia asiatica TaxID=238800 RepID=A0A510G9L8_9RICK|nr:hypothetical protein RAS_05640 [Rickettsia asiatica]